MSNKKGSIIKNSKLVTAILTIIAGLVLIIAPGSAVGLVCTIFGIVMIVCGAGHLIAFFSSGGALKSELISSIVFLLLGILLMFHSDKLISLIFCAVGIGVLIDGIGKIAAGISYSASKVPLIMGIISAVGGLVLIVAPFTLVDIVVRIAGIVVLVNGVCSFAAAKTTGEQYFSTSDK